MSHLSAPATRRNRGPILDVLRQWLPSRGTVLEIACGSGEHAAHFASSFPGLQWQPTDVDAEARRSTDSWCGEIDNVLPALELDTRWPEWPVDRADAIFCANMIHIAPIEAGLGLLSGAGRILSNGGVLVVYGPFRRNGRHTAPSNAEFDENLRARNPAWGVRDLELVVDEAAKAGLAHRATVEMPAHNLTLVFVSEENREKP